MSFTCVVNSHLKRFVNTSQCTTSHGEVYSVVYPFLRPPGDHYWFTICLLHCCKLSFWKAIKRCSDTRCSCQQKKAFRHKICNLFVICQTCQWAHVDVNHFMDSTIGFTLLNDICMLSYRCLGQIKCRRVVL